MTIKKKLFPWLLMVLYLAAVAYLCFGKFDNLSGVPHSIWGIATDKLVHFAMFFPFPVLLYWCVDWGTKNVMGSMLMAAGIFTLGCLIAMGSELGQSLTTWRSADPKDFQADALALAISAMAAFFIDIFRKRP